MKTFEIPDYWLMGFCRSHPEATIQDAVAWWVQQEKWARS